MGRIVGAVALAVAVGGWAATAQARDLEKPIVACTDQYALGVIHTPYQRQYDPYGRQWQQRRQIIAAGGCRRLPVGTPLLTVTTTGDTSQITVPGFNGPPMQFMAMAADVAPSPADVAQAQAEQAAKVAKEQAEADARAVAQAAEQRKLNEAKAADDRAKAQQEAEAEAAPDNRCSQPDVAKAVMDGTNRWIIQHDGLGEVVDLEHVTTRRLDPDHGVIECHVTLVLANGQRIIGLFSTHKNIAGEILPAWQSERYAN